MQTFRQKAMERGWAILGSLMLGVVLCGCGKKLATVNGEPITWKEFFDRLQREQPDFNQPPWGAQMVNRLIHERLILEEARKLGLEPTVQEVEEGLANFRQQFGNDQAYYQYLKSNGIEEEDIRERHRVSLALFKLRTMDLNPTPEDLRTFYRENRAQLFDTPPLLRFRQIVVDSKEKANELYRKLVVEGMDFEALARADSIDASNQNGGDMGLRPAAEFQDMFQQMGAPHLFKLVSELPVDKPSQPVKYTYINPETGERKDLYFLFLVVERQDTQVARYEEMEALAKALEREPQPVRPAGLTEEDWTRLTDHFASVGEDKTSQSLLAEVHSRLGPNELLLCVGADPGPKGQGQAKRVAWVATREKSEQVQFEAHTALQRFIMTVINRGAPKKHLTVLGPGAKEFREAVPEHLGHFAENIRRAYLNQKAVPEAEVLQRLAAKANVTIYAERYQPMEQMYGPPREMPNPTLPSEQGQGPGTGSKPAAGGSS